jgi:DNA repair protein RecO (recombination protein O)
MVYSGAMLLSLGREELSDASVCADARRLLRAALDRCLDGRELRTRQVMLALRKGK